jgi:hypothetical protein
MAVKMMMMCIALVLCARGVKGVTASIVVGRGTALVVMVGFVWTALISKNVLNVEVVLVPIALRTRGANLVLVLQYILHFLILGKLPSIGCSLTA